MNWLTVRYAAEGIALLVLLLVLVDSLVSRAARGWHCRREWQVLDLPPVSGVWIECTEDELLYITRLEMVWGVSRSEAARALLCRGGLEDGEQIPAQEESASTSQLSPVR